MLRPKVLMLAFIAGFLATLIFHQGVLGLLYLAGRVAMAPWNLTPVPPLGVPQVISLAFWGGLWGIALWALIRSRRGVSYWALAIALGALLPSLVAWFVVFPLKGIALSATLVFGALLLNGAWGLGVGLYMRLFRA
ncbi:hypothetical protein [Aquimonas sp.]|jgi:hypothetical protein|uniref:hypothetical protein n=1 Tax=Aquimonas sp. TaxID=1872588 RepID=UPI0037C09F43